MIVRGEEAKRLREKAELDRLLLEIMAVRARIEIIKNGG